MKVLLLNGSPNANGCINEGLTIMAKEFEKDRITIEMNRANQELKIKYYIKYINKEGRLFPRTIISAYYKGSITYGEMCQKLNVNSKHIANMERAVMFR